MNIGVDIYAQIGIFLVTLRCHKLASILQVVLRRIPSCRFCKTINEY